jgi:hypothetical protein
MEIAVYLARIFIYVGLVSYAVYAGAPMVAFAVAGSLVLAHFFVGLAEYVREQKRKIFI